MTFPFLCNAKWIFNVTSNSSVQRRFKLYLYQPHQFNNVKLWPCRCPMAVCPKFWAVITRQARSDLGPSAAPNRVWLPRKSWPRSRSTNASVLRSSPGRSVIACCPRAPVTRTTSPAWVGPWAAFLIPPPPPPPPKKKKGRHLADDIFICICVNEIFFIVIKTSPSLFLWVQLTIIQHWFSLWLGAE